MISNNSKYIFIKTFNTIQGIKYEGNKWFDLLNKFFTKTMKMIPSTESRGYMFGFK